MKCSRNTSAYDDWVGIMSMKVSSQFLYNNESLWTYKKYTTFIQQTLYLLSTYHVLVIVLAVSKIKKIPAFMKTYLLIERVNEQDKLVEYSVLNGDLESLC